MRSRSRRLSRFVAVFLSALLLWPQLITPSFAIFPQANGNPPPRRRVNWPGRRPNLDVERNRPAHVPQQHEPNSSDVRSPRMPQRARGWRRVGDPLPTPAPNGGLTLNAPHAEAWTDGNIWASMDLAHFAEAADATAGTPREAVADTNETHLSHAPAPPPSLSITQWLNDFHQTALLRPANTGEFNHWDAATRRSQAQGQDSVQSLAREMGRSVFDAAEYMARATSDAQYVSDLYWAYLRRAPDGDANNPATGWGYWTSQVAPQGRENVRRAFDESGEFYYVLSTVTTGANPGPAANLLSAQLDPLNATGGGGVDPISRNFNWSMPLIGLPGRAGLDLGLSLSYNSLVWTQSGPYAYFDEENGFPGPGFRLGFPVIQERVFNAQAGADSYLLLTPNGGRVELRQNGGVYESVDGSYLQLGENYNQNGVLVSLTLRTTDGTQMSYAKVNNEWRCAEVKDRNGNYLTVTYQWWGQINQITDTPGRVLTFVYDSKKKITKITQAWAGGATQNWARFEYQSVTLNALFGGYQLVGARNGQKWPMLNRVLLPDNSSYRFIYNTQGQTQQQGQVQQIDNYAADGVSKLNHVRYSIGDGPLVDRVTEARVWADDWNGEAESAPTTYAAPAPANWTGPHNGVARTGLKSVVTGPDGVQTRLYYADAGWQRGLVELTQTVVNNVVERWSTTDFTAGNGVNPRPTETNVGDPLGNRRRATIAYDSYGYGLPSDVREWTGAGGATLYRSSHTDYQWDGAYTSRRIIGLPAAQYACDGAIGETAPCGNASGASLVAKVTYKYDDPAWTEHLQAHSAAATQHDGTNYGPGFTVRGNLYATTRWDVTAPNDTSKIVENKVGYYITGAPRFTRANGPNGAEQVTLDYADQFSDGTNPPVSYNTFAYPTTITDPDGFQSKSEYNFSFGAPVKAAGPPPAGQSQGAIVRRVYDAIGRLERVKTEFNGNADYSYTRWTYPATGNMVNQYATITDNAGEAYSFTKTDGLGRSLFAVSEHPGSTGGYSTVRTAYDNLGRAVEVSVPTETNAATIPTGDDAAGYLYKTQTYDWKGRPLISTNTDGTITEAQYGGCGCAGGETVTLIGEQLAEGRRRQKIYSDSLGRQFKTEILNWDGTVYASTVTEYNVRDQVRFVNRAGLYSETQYDGHGRVWKQSEPVMTAGTWTTYAYNQNDTVQSVTDPRGATQQYLYNARRLVTNVNYTAPSNITPTAPVSFLYDAAANRTQMVDGSGSKTYQYDSLSRMSAETQIITGVAGAHTISYTYNLAGALKSLTDPQGRTVNYGYDRIGRLSGVTGNGYQVRDYNSGNSHNVNQLAGDFQYRAWGAVKRYTRGDPALPSSLSALYINNSYNARLQISHFDTSVNGGQLIANSNYSYYADGQTKFVDDLVTNNLNVPEHRFDRAYRYDHQGRLIEGLSGAEARGGAAIDGPYRETYGYDVSSNMTSRTARLWSTGSDSFSHTYLNGRNQAWQYDATGHVTMNEGQSYEYDAAGRPTKAPAPFSGVPNEPTGYASWYGESAQTYNGDGEVVKQIETDTVYDFPTRSYYYIRSTVLGGREILTLGNVIIRGNGSNFVIVGESGNVSIYLGRERLAMSSGGYIYNLAAHAKAPVTGDSLGVRVNPLNQSVGTYDPILDNYGDAGNVPVPHEYGNAEDVNLGCVADGIATACSQVEHLLKIHAADAVKPDFASGAGDIADFATDTEYQDYDDGTPITIGKDGTPIVPSLRYRTLIRTSFLPVSQRKTTEINARKLTKQEQKVFNLAFNDAFSRAANSTACAEAISGAPRGNLDITQAVTNVLDAISKTVTNAGNGYGLDGESFAQVSEGSIGARSNAHISVFNTFFDEATVIVDLISRRGALPAKNNVNIPVFTPTQARSLILLHELAHTFGRTHNNIAESYKLNDEILEACFPEVANALKAKYGTINPK